MFDYVARSWKKNQIYIVNTLTGNIRLLVEDSDPQWITFTHDLNWIQRNGKAEELLVLSEKDGWRHGYLVNRSTGAMRLITNFKADVVQYVSLDVKNRYFYFIASPDDPGQRYLYRSRLDGSGTPERVTPANEAGTNLYDVSPDNRWAIHTFSNATSPNRYDLVSLPEHASVRLLKSNEDVVKKVAGIVLPIEFSETPVSSGVTLGTLMIKPPNFDPAKKYPVFTIVYGEAAGQTVTDRWSTSNLFLHLIAREGYVVVSFDNQGTPAPRGAAWRRAGYGQPGVLSSQQQKEAIEELAKKHGYLDTTRMAIWGWSGGGTNTLNMMFRHPEVYGTGIDVAGVPDLTRYDSIYQEHFSGLLSDNVSGYHDGSPINFAQGLRGNLLIIHGTGDDNVHYQGTELLENRLIELGKPFDFMAYPNRTHAISEGKGTSYHVYLLIAHYLETHVPAGAK